MEALGGKVAVVTGGASGIGYALASAFANDGMRVVLADVERGPLDEAAARLEGDGAEVLAVPTDVRDPDALLALRDATYDRFGTAHVVCNNAGVAGGGPSWDIDPARYKWVIDVNLLGVAYGIHAFVPRMVEQGEGHVVNTASAAGLITGPFMAPYNASKHAVVAMSETLLFDLQATGATGVGVTVLCPEWVRTRINEADRNRPDDVPEADGPVDERASLMRQFLDGLIANGTDPDDIAAMVLDAVKANRFYVVPHAVTTIPRAKVRWHAIEHLGTPELAGLFTPVE